MPCPIRNLYTKMIRFYVFKKCIKYSENQYHVLCIKKSITYKKILYTKQGKEQDYNLTNT